MSSTTNLKSEGQLDPGPPPRRESTSGCKCLLLSVIISFTVGCMALILAATVEGVGRFLAPFTHIYYNATLHGATPSPAMIVRPLIDRQQSFDLAATVWLRTSEWIHRDPNHYTPWIRQGGKWVQPGPIIEEPLFSDIIFRGVRLTDINLHTSVNFTLPTTLFKNIKLANYDLRGSVTLIPSSPSLLDYVSNYSSYIPDYVQVLPVRSWPFPMHSPERTKVMADHALESFGVSVPLIQFHGIQSRCSDTGEKVTEESMSVNLNDNYNEELEDQTRGLGSFLSADLKSRRKSWLEFTAGRSVLKAHPYIVTRTQIRVLDESQMFDRKAYTKERKRLQLSSCGQPAMSANQFYCKRPYLENGNLETLLELSIPDNSTEKTHKEWAYAPFLSVSRFAFGLKDLLAIPVNRENCSDMNPPSRAWNGSSALPERKSIDVSWKISYSGRTPAKMIVAEEVLETPQSYNFDDAERHQSFKQDSLELLNGVFGHQFRAGAHPRRRSFLAFLIRKLAFVISCLQLRYWYTRRSTVSISIPGTAFLVTYDILDTLRDFTAEPKNQSYVRLILILLSSISSLVVPIAQLKAILRIDVGWRAWFPVLRRSHATHLERTSERMDARMSLLAKFAFYFTVVAIYYFLAPHTYQLIEAHAGIDHPWLDEFSGLIPAFLIPIYDVGKIFQLILNWRSHSYAGGYRITSAIVLVRMVAWWSMFVPAIVGEFEIRGPLLAHTVLLAVLTLITTWQALTLRSVRQTVDENQVD